MHYILLSIIFLGIQLVIQNPTQAQEQNAPSENLELREFACNAFDPQSLKSCIREVSESGMPLIRITSPITCQNRDECDFEIKNMARSFEISPSKPENKIIRQGDFGYTLFTIENSSGVSFRKLGFEDLASLPCPAATACPPLISIKNSGNLNFEGISLLKTAGTGINISDSRDISITDSVFKESFRTAVEVSSAGFTRDIKIDNNVFDSNASSAVVFQAISLAGSPSSISSNSFVNNHAKGMYLNCSYPCAGGQIRVNGPTSNLNINQNTINGGQNTVFDFLGLYASGIEISGQNLSGIMLYCNEISGNRGSGIVQSGPFVNISAVTISENKIWGNGLNLNIPTVTPAQDNCYTQECKLSCSK